MSRLNHVHYVAPLPGEPDLFNPLEPRIPDPVRDFGSAEILAPSVAVDTSLEAAAKITTHTARIREAIYLWLKTQGSHGATCGEICTALGLSGSTVRPRLVELRGEAKWAPGLPKRIIRTWGKRLGMRIYEVVR